MQLISSFYQFKLGISTFWSFMTSKSLPIFDHNHPEKIKVTFIPLISSRETANFRVLWPEWAHPFMTRSTQFFQSTFNSMNLHQHAKNQTFSSFYSLDVFVSKILQSQTCQ